MSVPTDPTLTTMSAEVWLKAGITSPTSAQTTRLQNEFLEEVLDEIWNTALRTGFSTFKTLEELTTFNSVRGQSYIDLGVGFDEERTISILDGSIRGTCTAGTTTSITLASDDAQTVTGASGKKIFITSGTGINQLRQITALNTTSKVATVDSTWTTPVSGDTYLIVDKPRPPLEEISPEELEEAPVASEGIPTAFAKYKRQILFDRPFDLSTYGIAARHFLNIHEVDRAAAIYTAILQNWRACLVQGLLWKCFESQGDAQADAAYAKFEGKSIPALIYKETPYGGGDVSFSVA